MNRQAFDPATFTSRMTKGELIAVLLYLPLHVWLLPLLLFSLPAASGISELQINLIVYVAGALYMLLFAGRFLRRDFDPLCDHFQNSRFFQSTHHNEQTDKEQERFIVYLFQNIIRAFFSGFRPLFI